MTPHFVVEGLAGVLSVVAFGWVARSTIGADDLRRVARARMVAVGRLLVTVGLASWLVHETTRVNAVPGSPWELALWLLWLPALAGYLFEYRCRLERL